METQLEPTTPSPDVGNAPADDQTPTSRITRLIADVLDRRERGELVSESELITQHPDLMPELAYQLQALRLVQRAYATARRAGPIDDPLNPVDVDHLDAPIDPEPEANSDASPDAAVPQDAFPPDPTPPLPKIPGYELNREISSGGQATVYRATRAATGEDVAVKILPGGPFVTSKNRARFEREADILGALRHPNVVGILDRGRTPDGSFFLVMPYVAGAPLDAFGTSCRAGGDAPFPRRILTVFEKVARAVHAAHVAGVVHRDLKPSNVLVDDRDEPHLLDFGLARLQAATPLDPDARHPDGAGIDWRRHTVTVSGQVIGSLPWSSPEQASGHSNKVDARADVYALGVCLYEALTGRLPLPSIGGVREALEHICNTAPAPLGTTRRRITGADPDAVEAVVLRALAKSPDRRQPTAAALADELRAVLDGRPVRPAPAPLPYVRPARPRHLRPWIVAVAPASSLSLPAWYFWPQFRPTPRGVVVFRQPMQANSVGMRLIRIPPGAFHMGSAASGHQRRDDEYWHNVRITRPFWLGEKEVTVEQYYSVMHRYPPNVDPKATHDSRMPATLVSWDDAMEFCRRLSETEKKSYRLPTEAEWEYACRAGTQAPWAGDENPDTMAWHKGNSSGLPHVTGSTTRNHTGWNHWGLYDMHGNVAEWCLDHYVPDYLQTVDDPVVLLEHPDPYAHRVVRGGSYLNSPVFVRSAARDFLSPDTRRPDVGFRVVRDEAPFPFDITPPTDNP
jgi:formylglycine-generating enzyme required for sulfatase activity